MRTPFRLCTPSNVMFTATTKSAPVRFSSPDCLSVVYVMTSHVTLPSEKPFNCSSSFVRNTSVYFSSRPSKRPTMRRAWRSASAIRSATERSSFSKDFSIFSPTCFRRSHRSTLFARFDTCSLPTNRNKQLARHIINSAVVAPRVVDNAPRHAPALSPRKQATSRRPGWLRRLAAFDRGRRS